MSEGSTPECCAMHISTRGAETGPSLQARTNHAATLEADIQAILKLGFSLHRGMTGKSANLPRPSNLILHSQHFNHSWTGPNRAFTLTLSSLSKVAANAGLRRRQFRSFKTIAIVATPLRDLLHLHVIDHFHHHAAR